MNENNRFDSGSSFDAASFERMTQARLTRPKVEFSVVDPSMDATHRTGSSVDAIAIADRLQIGTILARDVDGEVSHFGRKEDGWAREDGVELADIQKQVDSRSVQAIVSGAEARRLAGTLDAPQERLSALADADAFRRIADPAAQAAAAAVIAENGRQSEAYLRGVESAFPGYPGTAKRIAELDAAPRQEVREVNLPNEVAGVGVGATGPVRRPVLHAGVPENVGDRFVQVGNKLVDPVSNAGFVDKGSKLQTDKAVDPGTIRAMVDVAEHRGWDSIKVSGDAAFRRSVYFEAASRGLAVQGYTPTEAERVSAAAAAERAGKVNRIEHNPVATAFLSAKTPEDQKTAAKAHPELRQAFALEAAFRSFSQQRLAPGAHEAFVARQRDNIAIDLSQGKALPAVSVRAERNQGQRRERAAEQDR